MKKKILFVTDVLDELDLKKDTSVLMMEESLIHGFDIYQCEMNKLYVENKQVKAFAKRITLASIEKIEFEESIESSLTEYSYCFMRKDPPVDENYINTLHLLSLAKEQGVSVFNDPLSIKEFNEKVFALHFSKYIPKTLISSEIKKIEKFFNENGQIIVKPLDGMGGKSIYKLDKMDESEKTILKEITNNETTQIISQEFIKEIYDGDFRVLIIHGKPFIKTLARIPQGNSFKGNLAAGGKGVVKDITEFQHNLASEIGNFLMKKGINFAGIDVIGEYLTEINITSPTCARQILDQSGMNAAKEYIKNL